MSANLRDITSFLDRELRIRDISDYAGAVNGLQLECDRAIPRVVAAVDACLPVIEQAAADGPGLLIVHHGMFWQGAQPVTGAWFRKLKTAMNAGLAIYSSHLPLDLHPVWGNNVLLANALGIEDPVPFLEHKNQPMGLRGTWRGTRDALAAALRTAVGGEVLLCPGGPNEIRSVGLVTGGAGTEVARAAESGVDAFITGEAPHWAYPLAEECGINLLLGGHYATETFGVKAVAEAVSTHFGIPFAYIDHPTGL